MSSLRPPAAQSTASVGRPLFAFTSAQLSAHLSHACALVGAPAQKRPVEGGSEPGQSRPRGADAAERDSSGGETDVSPGPRERAEQGLTAAARVLRDPSAVSVDRLRALQSRVYELSMRDDVPPPLRQELSRALAQLQRLEATRDADATQMDLPEGESTEEESDEQIRGATEELGGGNRGGGGGNDDDDDGDMQLEEEEEEEEAGEEADAIDRVVGRAVTLYNRRPQKWFLTVWTGKPVKDATWLPEADFDTPARRRLLAAFKALTGGETDPQLTGFVRGVVATRTRGRGRQKHTEYKVQWLTTELGVPDRLASEWLRRRQVVNPERALGARDQGAEPDADSSSDDDGSSDDDDDDGPPPGGPGEADDEGGGATLKVMVWDAGAARAKVSLRGAIATLEAEPPYLLDALDEWCSWRLYVLECLAPRASNVTDADVEQLCRDLYDIDRERLDALIDEGVDQEEHEEQQRALLKQQVLRGWRRRRRRRQRDTRTIRAQLLALKSIRARRAAEATDESEPSQLAPETQLGGSQAPADADGRVQADARRIVDAERAVPARRWFQEYADPPVRMHAQANLLTGEKVSGGSRNKRQRLFLGWLRELHTSKEAEFRRGNGTYAREWTQGDWGSPYSTFWPQGALATSASVNLEHIVPSEWLRNGEVVRENGYARQDVTITTLTNQTENSARNDKPLAVFGPASDEANARLYVPPESSRPKKTRLALATCHGVLTYSLVGQETKAAGSKKFAGNFGVPEYARRLAGLRRYALAEPSLISRRIALITSHRHKFMNPLVLRSGLLRVQRYANLLGMRLRGGRATDDPSRLECGLALLTDDVLARELGDAPA